MSEVKTDKLSPRTDSGTTTLGDSGDTFSAGSGVVIAAQALTATTGVFSSDVTGLTINATGDTAASDNAAIGYTAAEGLILTGQGSTDDITIKNDADTTVVNVATGATDVEVSAGNILFGTADKGVYLGVTSATAANLLDDYEEGTYNPTVTGRTSGGWNLAASYDTLSYTKIGRLVTIFGYFDVASDNSPSGQVQISLPFAPVSMAESSDQGASYSVVLHSHADADANSDLYGWVTTGNSYCRLYESAHGTGVSSYLIETEVDAVFGISMQLFYYSTG